MFGGRAKATAVFLLLWRMVASATPDHPLFAPTIALLLTAMAAALGALGGGAAPAAFSPRWATDAANARWAWAAVLRGVSLVNLHTCAWFMPVTMWGMVGAQGLWPAEQSLARLRRDYSVAARAQYFPSLLWLTGGSDAALMALNLAMVACALGTLAGSRHSPLLFFGFFATTASFSVLEGWWQWVPGDCLILELNLLVALLPAPAPAAPRQRWWHLKPLSRVPSRTSAFCLRFLAFRVILGMGLHKFRGSRVADITEWLPHFFLANPLTPRSAYLARLLLGDHNPVWAAAYGFFGVVELVCSFGFLVPLPAPPAATRTGAKVNRPSWRYAARGIAGVATATLMTGIQFTVHYSLFPMNSLLLSLTALLGDAGSCHPAQPLQVNNGRPPPQWRRRCSRTLRRVCLACYSTLAMCFFAAPSQWVFPIAMYWDWTVDAALVSPRMAALLPLARTAASWRVLHTYGVFTPGVNSPIMPRIAYEVTWDDDPSAPSASWQLLRFKGQVAEPDSAPNWNVFGPFLKFDFLHHWAAALGGVDNPLATAYVPNALASPMKLWHRIARRVLHGGSAAASVHKLFGSVPAPPPGWPCDAAPVAIRARLRKFMHPRAHREEERLLHGDRSKSTTPSVATWWVEVKCNGTDAVARKHWASEAAAGAARNASACGVADSFMPAMRRADVDRSWSTDEAWLLPPAAIPNFGGYAALARQPHSVDSLRRVVSHSAWVAFWRVVGAPARRDAQRMAWRGAPARDRAQFYDIMAQLSTMVLRATGLTEHCYSSEMQPICKMWAAEAMAAVGEDRFVQWLQPGAGAQAACAAGIRATALRTTAFEHDARLPFAWVANEGTLGSLDRWGLCTSNAVLTEFIHAMPHIIGPLGSCISIRKRKRLQLDKLMLAAMAKELAKKIHSSSGILC
jgi:hypothetical protein